MQQDQRFWYDKISLTTLDFNRSKMYPGIDFGTKAFVFGFPLEQK